MTDLRGIGFIGKPGRHRWGEPSRFQYKTERICQVCGLIKVTRHAAGEYPWLEFWRGSQKLSVERTPPCEVSHGTDSAPVSPGAASNQADFAPVSTLSTGGNRA